MRKVFWLLVFLALSTPNAHSQAWERLNAAGSRLMDEGHPAAALKLYQASLASLPPDDSLHRGAVFHNLASAHYALGSYWDALEYLDRAEKECGSVNYNTRGSLLQSIGRMKEAEEDFTTALDMAKDRREEAAIRLNLGALQLQQGRSSDAISNAFLALYKTRGPLDSLLAYRILQRASVLEHNLADAASFLRSCHSVLERHFAKDEYQQILQLTTEAYTLELAGKYPEALQLYEKALPLWRAFRGEVFPESISVAYGVAKSALNAGKKEHALKAYLDYIPYKLSYLSSEAMRLSQDDLRSFWRTSNEGIVDAPLYAEIAAEKQPEALGTLLNAVMLSKGFSRETVQSFRKQVRIAGDPVTDSLYTAFLESRADLAHYDRNHSASLEKQITERLRQKGLKASTAFSPDWKRSQKRLTKKSVAVEFTESGAFVYKKGDKHPAFIPLSPYEFTIQGQAPDSWELKEMYTCFWQPLEPYIGKADTVFFAPSGDGHFLPLEAATDSTGIPLRNLHQAIIRLVSTADIPDIGIHPVIREYILFGDMDYHTPASERAFGFFSDIPYLEGSAKEMDEISALLGGKVCKVFRGDDASEEAFRSLRFNPKSPSLIHFSTHGVYFSYEDALKMMFYDDNYSKIVLEENPMLRTALLMSGAYDQWLALHHNPLHDATITAQEISEMDLRGVSLAVLAACKTAVGDDSPEGALGFPYAFKLAGAGATLATLWPVNDKVTSILMPLFYKLLLEGKSPEGALKSASEHIRTQPEYSNPHFWAPFIIVH